MNPSSIITAYKHLNRVELKRRAIEEASDAVCDAFKVPRQEGFKAAAREAWLFASKEIARAMLMVAREEAEEAEASSYTPVSSSYTQVSPSRKFPTNSRSIRKQQTKTPDSNICPTYPARGSGTLACIWYYLFEFFERPKVLLIVEPAHTRNFNIFCIGFYGSCIRMSKASGSGRVWGGGAWRARWPRQLHHLHSVGRRPASGSESGRV